MFKVPVTYLFDFECTDDKTRPYVMHEFAVNGAKHLVLSDTMISMIMRSRRLQDQVLSEMAAEGLSFCDAHAPFGPKNDMFCADPANRPQMLLRQKLVLQITADMGVKTITIHTGNETNQPGVPLEVQYDCVKRSLDELLPFAESLGVTICIENIWWQINTPERLLGIKAQFPTDALGFCYDAGHANLMDKGRNSRESSPFKVWGETPPQFDDHILEKMLPHVVNCHLHDNDGVTDQHLNPGRGNVDWKKIIPLLKTAPRLAVVQSEVIPVRVHDSIRDICAKFRELGEL
ncbi:MAG: sugar phosphate isomerase/epimerase [Lentisphaeria bacterium]|nr:sugar phosphate isomerase/epimerase [Lentisphaeria bacterium]